MLRLKKKLIARSSPLSSLMETGDSCEDNLSMTAITEEQPQQQDQVSSSEVVVVTPKECGSINRRVAPPSYSSSTVSLSDNDDDDCIVVGCVRTNCAPLEHEPKSIDQDDVEDVQFVSVLPDNKQDLASKADNYQEEDAGLSGSVVTITQSLATSPSSATKKKVNPYPLDSSLASFQRRLLSCQEDEKHLNKVHCLVRKHIEIFLATQADIEAPAPGRKKRILPQQVGLRCIHCAHLPTQERVKRAICYPSSIARIYHCVSDMKFDHIPHCNSMPQELKQELLNLKKELTACSTNDQVVSKSETSRNSRTTAKYYQESAKKLGIVDRSKEGGVFPNTFVGSDSSIRSICESIEDNAISKRKQTTTAKQKIQDTGSPVRKKRKLSDESSSYLSRQGRDVPIRNEVSTFEKTKGSASDDQVEVLPPESAHVTTGSRQKSTCASLTFYGDEQRKPAALIAQSSSTAIPDHDAQETADVGPSAIGQNTDRTLCCDDSQSQGFQRLSSFIKANVIKNNPVSKPAAVCRFTDAAVTSEMKSYRMEQSLSEGVDDDPKHVEQLLMTHRMQCDKKKARKNTVLSETGFASSQPVSAVVDPFKQDHTASATFANGKGSPSSMMSICDHSEKSYSPLPDASSSQKSVLLARKEDSLALNELHCFVRQNIELFSATEQDVSSPSPGRRHRVNLGQVGLRCIHCCRGTISDDVNAATSKQKQQKRAKRAVCYPPSLHGIYHCVSNMKFDHFEVCKSMPVELKAKLKTLKETSNRKGGTQSANCTAQYYYDSAVRLGLVDSIMGIRFSNVTAPSSGFVKPDSSKYGDGDGAVHEPRFYCGMPPQSPHVASTLQHREENGTNTHSKKIQDNQSIDASSSGGIDALAYAASQASPEASPNIQAMNGAFAQRQIIDHPGVQIPVNLSGQHQLKVVYVLVPTTAMTTTQYPHQNHRMFLPS